MHFLAPAAKSEHALHTALALDARSVLQQYSHGSDEACDVTFNLKDFKVLLALCEHMQVPVSIR